LLQAAFTSAASNLLHALNSTAEQSVLDKIVDLINDEQRTMKSSPIASVEARDLDNILTNPVVMLFGGGDINEPF
jgi:hypothetical protein